MAAVQITTSFNYRCPPGTGTPNELSATLSAINKAVMHSQTVVFLAETFFCGILNFPLQLEYLYYTIILVI